LASRASRPGPSQQARLVATSPKRGWPREFPDTSQVALDVCMRNRPGGTEPRDITHVGSRVFDSTLRMPACHRASAAVKLPTAPRELPDTSQVALDAGNYREGPSSSSIRQAHTCTSTTSGRCRTSRNSRSKRLAPCRTYNATCRQDSFNQ
jgi:hypothetical protein